MKSPQASGGRRRFLTQFAGLASLALPAGAQSSNPAPPQEGRASSILPSYARAQDYESLKQASNDPSGGNHDYWEIGGGKTRDVFRAEGPGVITHIWFTIAAESEQHLKEVVLRAWWDSSDRPSIETPIGDFFGLNLGEYVNYQSAYLACSPAKSLNCYFAMPYRSSARISVTNDSKKRIPAFYSNIDYQRVAALPEDALYFHAQYRQAAPCVAVAESDARHNKDGKRNYVFAETHGRGHVMGVSLGVLQNADGWWGEGDEMIFIDDEKNPAINGTGSEDYFLGSWDFGGKNASTPFGYMQYGAPLIMAPERAGGRYCCYRFHGDNPVTFRKYLRYTIEHGHGNNRGDNFYSVAYWYQDHPSIDFPGLPPAGDRIPRLRAS